MGRLAPTASNHGQATGFDPAPKKFSSREMGLDASRDEGAHPSVSHRTGQTLTQIIQSNFVGECCFTSCRMDSQYVKIGLTYQLYSFSIRPSLAWKERIGLAEWYYPRINHDDAMVGALPTRRVVWSGREDLNLRHPAPKAGLFALP